MKINPISQQNKNFGSGLSSELRKFVLNTSATQTELQLKKRGIQAYFHKNKLIAALCNETNRIFEGLKLYKPGIIKTYKPFFQQSTIGIAQNHAWNTELLFNRSYFRNPEQYDNFCNYLMEQHGCTHVLQPIIHEFSHSDHYKKAAWAKDQMFIYNANFNIDMSKFNDEIANRIGIYATKNPFELHATYQAKEICDSLDENWHLRYNPIKEPKTKLSKKLKAFLDAISRCDSDEARRITEGNI